MPPHVNLLDVRGHLIVIGARAFSAAPSRSDGSFEATK